METKLCNGCNILKSVLEFGKNLEGHPRHRCKLCLNKEARSYKKKLGGLYLNQRRLIKQKRKQQDPIRFHVQERISSWRKKDNESDLTVDYLIKLWENQKGLCYYTNVKMVPGGHSSTIKTSASLDKLDPSKGYKQGNVVWVCHLSNTSKGPRTEAEFYEFCRMVLEQAGKRE